MSLVNKKSTGLKNQSDPDNQRKCSNQMQLTVQQKTKMIILQAKLELDEMILHLDDKIRKRMEINQCKFVVAYNNHLAKITKELKHLKQTYDVYERKFSADKALTNLVKQCTLFRQQAMRLHSQLEDALAQVDVFKRKSQILEKELKNSDDLAKRLITLNKVLEAQKLALILEGSKQKQKIEKIEADMAILQNKAKQNNDKKQNTINSLRIMTPNKARKKISVQIKQQNKTFTKRTQDSKTQQINESYRYPVFESNFDLFNPSTPSDKKLTKKSRARNKTTSTLCYHSKNDMANHHQSQKHGSQKQNQMINYKHFKDLVNSARERIDRAEETYLIQSKNIGDFLNSKEDISSLCQFLFPNHKRQSEKEEANTNRNRSSEKLKTLSYLSSQLMKKFQLTKTKIDKNKSENTLHLSSDELKFISEKSRLKTEFESKNVETDGKPDKLQKMNESFKRKTVFNKSVLSFSQRSARVINKKQ